MNQILSTENPNDRMNNGSYGSYKSKGPTGPIDIKKVIKIFAIAIIILGLVLGIIFAIRASKNKKNPEVVKPQIELGDTGEGQATIQVISEVGLNKLTYYFDEADVVEVPLDGKTEYEIGVDIPNGENTLFVEVVDVNNQVTKASNFYVGAGDAELPVIELVEPEELKGTKMIIKAKDETELSYITYKWITGYNTDEEQEEEEIRIDLEPGTTETEQEVDIKRGTNKVIVKVYDTAGNFAEEEEIYSARLDPDIIVYRDETKIHMKIIHDMGFKKVEFSVNGQVYSYDENYYAYDATKTELYYTFDLRNGENQVAIIAISNEETRKEYSAVTTYP